MAKKSSPNKNKESPTKKENKPKYTKGAKVFDKISDSEVIIYCADADPSRYWIDIKGVEWVIYRREEDLSLKRPKEEKVGKESKKE